MKKNGWREASNIACVFLIAAGTIGCSGTPRGGLPREDLELRPLVLDECTGCETASWELSEGTTQVSLGPPIATSADISGIRGSSSDGHVIQILYRPEAATRIHARTQALVGRPVAFVAGGAVLLSMDVSAPFGESSQIELPSAQEGINLYSSLIQLEAR